MSGELEKGTEAQNFAVGIEKQENRLFMFDSPDAIMLAKKGTTFLINKDAYFFAVRKGSLSLGVDSLIDSIGVVDAFIKPTKLDSQYVDIAFQDNKKMIPDILACNALLYALLSLSVLSSEKVELIPEPEREKQRDDYRMTLNSIFCGSKERYFKPYFSAMISTANEQFWCPAFLAPLIRPILSDLTYNGFADCDHDDKKRPRTFQKLFDSLLRNVNSMKLSGKDDSIRKRKERTRAAYVDLSARIEGIISTVSDNDVINNALLEVLKEQIFHPQLLSSIVDHRIHKYSFLLEMEMPIVFGRKHIKFEDCSPRNRFYSFKNLVELVSLLAVDLCDGDYKKACNKIRELLQERRFNKLLHEKHSGKLVHLTGKKKEDIDANLARAQLAALFGTVDPRDYEMLLESVPAAKFGSDEKPLKFEDGHIRLKEHLHFDMDCSFSFKFANRYSVEYFKEHPDVLSDAIRYTLSTLYPNKENANTCIDCGFELKSSDEDRIIIEV